jgi:hypothetical protein
MHVYTIVKNSLNIIISTIDQIFQTIFVFNNLIISIYQVDQKNRINITFIIKILILNM